MATYERLTGLDEAFLGFETANAHMHVAVTALLEAGPLRTPSGGVDKERIHRHFASRLRTLPRFRQRLEFVPFTQDAVWVDDERFDLKYHLRHISLPRPGTTAQLQECCAEILERPLSRSRPLWEAWVVEGVGDDEFALIVKVHHCIVDGIAGIGRRVALLDPMPVDAPDVVPAWRPRPHPSRRELLRDEVARRVQGTVAVGQTMARSLVHLRDSADQFGTAMGSLVRLARKGLSAAPASCFNEPIGPHRRVAWLALDLDRIRRLKNRLGGTVNDVVLTAVSGALGSTLRRRNDPAGNAALRVVVPVSTRSAEEIGAPGNRVSLWLVPLPLAERDPRRRLARIRETTDELKRGQAAAGGTVITEAANWAGGAVVAAGARLLNGARLYNLIVTNVPGPTIPLYLLGARVRAAYPHLPLFENQGLGIALLSYCGQLHVGITADWDHGALLDEVAGQLDACFAELLLLAGEPPAAVVRPARIAVAG